MISSQEEYCFEVLPLLLVWVRKDWLWLRLRGARMHSSAVTVTLTLRSFQPCLTILSQVIWREALEAAFVFFQNVLARVSF